MYRLMDESVLPLKEEIKLLSSQHPTTPSEKVSVQKKGGFMMRN